MRLRRKEEKPPLRAHPAPVDNRPLPLHLDAPHDNRLLRRPAPLHEDPLRRRIIQPRLHLYHVPRLRLVLEHFLERRIIADLIRLRRAHLRHRQHANRRHRKHRPRPHRCSFQSLVLPLRYPTPATPSRQEASPSAQCRRKVAAPVRTSFAARGNTGTGANYRDVSVIRACPQSFRPPISRRAALLRDFAIARLTTWGFVSVPRYNQPSHIAGTVAQPS